MFPKLFLSGILLSAGILTLQAQDDGPGRQELSAAKYYTEQFEQAAERSRGKPFDPKRYGSGAMERVAALVKKYPDHPDVRELRERVRQCILRSKGDYVEITPAMVAYRNVTDRLKGIISDAAGPAWQEQMDALGEDRVPGAFPIPDMDVVGVEEMVGKKVVLTGFRYPTNEFTSSGTQYVSVGSPSLGYYFVRLTGTKWGRLYGAIQRYRADIGEPQVSEWKVIGKITSPTVMVPVTGEQAATSQAYEGWEIELEAIQIPGVLTVTSGADTDQVFEYAGEASVRDEIENGFTHAAPPSGEDPQEFVEAFIQSIKEKNYEVFYDFLDPVNRSGPFSGGRVKKMWEINQRRFADLYVHVAVENVGEPYAIRGEKIEDLESLFLTDDDIEGVQERADPLVEVVEVQIKHYDEKGKQVMSPNTVRLRRYEDKENNRWFVYDGYPL